MVMVAIARNAPTSWLEALGAYKGSTIGVKKAGEYRISTVTRDENETLGARLNIAEWRASQK
jgi:hypothetical protein